MDKEFLQFSSIFLVLIFVGFFGVKSCTYTERLKITTTERVKLQAIDALKNNVEIKLNFKDLKEVLE